MIVALPGLFSYLFFYIIKMGLTGSKLYRDVFAMSTDRPKTVLLFQYFVCRLFQLCCCELSLFVTQFLFFWCLEKAVFHACGFSGKIHL